MSKQFENSPVLMEAVKLMNSKTVVHLDDGCEDCIQAAQAFAMISIAHSLEVLVHDKTNGRSQGVHDD